MRVSATTRLRPTRIGFLADPNDMDSLRRIFQVCTVLWGGAFNPIIPVCDELPEAWRSYPGLDPTPAQLTSGYIDFFELDVFVEAKPGLAEKAGLSGLKLDFVHSRVVGIDEYFAAPHIPFGLDCRDVYQAIWNREFKFESSRERRVANFDAEGPDAAWIEMAFGGFPSAGPLEPFAKAFPAMFGASEFPPTAESWSKVVSEGFSYPLNFSGHQLEPHFHGQPVLTLFVADPASPLDVIDCWNLGQICYRVLPINLNWLATARDAVRAVLGPAAPTSAGDAIPRLKVQFGRSVVRSHHTEDFASARSRLQGANFDLPFVFDNYPELHRKPEDPWGMAARYGPQRVTLSAGTDSSELDVSGDLTCQPLAVAPDFADDFGETRAARWVNVLTFAPPWEEAEKLALTFPSSLDLTKPARMGAVTGSRLASREGLVLPQNYKHDRELIRLMTGTDALIAWLTDRDIKAHRSDAGRAADRVIERLGGLRRTHILHDQETIKLFDKAANDRRKSLHWNEWNTHLCNRANRAKQEGRFGPQMENLVDQGIVRLGLELNCPKCSEKNWYPITDPGPELVCEGCLGTFKFPEGTLNLKSPPWHYRVIGPFSKPKFADGAYAVVLALSLFASRLGSMSARCTYATGLDMRLRNKQGRPRNIECDFALWYCPRQSIFGIDPDPTLIFGEAKSFGREAFEARDVARMWRLWLKLPESFVVFATLKDGLDEGERRRIRRFASAVRTRYRPAPIIILTGTELFCDDNINAAWSKKLDARRELSSSPRHDSSNPWDLARLTQQAYLGLTEAELTAPPVATP